MDNLPTKRRTIDSRREPEQQPTQPEPATEIPGWLKNAGIDTGFIVCWLDHAILFGRIKNGTLCFPEGADPDYQRLQQLRAFDANRELFAWKTGAGYRRRLRVDGNKGESVEVLDAEQVLWGTSSEELGGGFSRVCDPGRGTELVVPLAGLNLSADRRLVLVTRNYLGEEPETGQVGFRDCRFVDLHAVTIDREGKK